MVRPRRRRNVALLVLAVFLGAAGLPAMAGGEQDPSTPPAGEGLLLVEVRSADGPREGAEVRASGRVARTDGAGQARVALPIGTQAVEVSAAGFLDVATTASLEAGATARLEVELRPAVTVEEEVIVTASRTNSRIQDEPLRVEVVDRQDIEEKALMTPGSVAMLLGETTGLRVQTTAPSVGAANVRIQGLLGRYTLLLSDGLPLYGVEGDSLSLLQVPPLDLAQVEIIKGAASALYGASALGGVVNLVSQHPRERQRQALANVTTRQGFDLAGWLVEPPRGRWAWTLLGGLHGQARQDVDGDGWADVPGFSRGTLRPRVFWDSGGGNSIFATVGIMAEDRRGGTLPDEAAPDGLPFAQDLDSRRLDVGAVGHFALGPSLLLSARGSFARRGERQVVGEDVERGHRTTGFGEAALRGTAGPHAWVVGAAVQSDSYDAQDLPRFDYGFTTPGVFAQDQVRLGARAVLGASARVDRHPAYGTFASPRVSLLFRPATSWRARLSAGTGFFAPTPFLEETEETGLARLLPLAGLVGERARSASLDLGFTRGRFDLNATLYGSEIREPLERRQVGAETFAIVNADGPVRTWGTELLARYRAPGFMLLVTHAYTNSTEEDPEAPGRRPVPLTPGHVLTLNATFEGEGWGRLGLEAYLTGQQSLSDDPYRTEGRTYLLFGALFEHRFGGVHAFVNLENVGNVRQTRWAPLLRPARAPDGRWTVDAWAPLDGFVLNGGVRIVF